MIKEAIDCAVLFAQLQERGGGSLLFHGMFLRDFGARISLSLAPRILSLALRRRSKTMSHSAFAVALEAHNLGGNLGGTCRKGDM